MKIIKIRMFFKKIIENVKIYLKLPHLKVLGIIVLLSILTLWVSAFSKDAYVSSLFANIFAGLVTGIVISVVSSVKSFSLYRTEVLINWLSKLHEDYLKYSAMSRKLLNCKKNDFATEKELEDYIYDVLCCGNDIAVTISQSRFNQSLPFDSYSYFKKQFNYDAEKHMETNNNLRDKIIAIDVTEISEEQIRTLFKDMNDILFSLNRNIVKKIDDLKIQQKATNTF